MTSNQTSEDHVWLQKLRRLLERSHETQAVSWDDDHTELSVATMGRIDEEAFRRLLEQVLTASDETGELDQKQTASPGIRVEREEKQTRLIKDHGCREVAELWTWRKIPWPSAAVAAGLEDEEEEDWRMLATLAAACGVFGIAGFAVDRFAWGSEWLPVLLYGCSMVFGGWDAARDAIPGLFRGRVDIHFLMLAVALGASAIGAFGEGALLLFLFSLAGALEHFALDRTRREIHSLFRIAPKTALLVDSDTGEQKSIAVEQILKGHRLIIRPGDIFPVDAEVTDGSTAADESSLTGEAHPVSKSVGSEVYSGTLNLWGALTVTCVRPASQSSLQKIIHLIQQARHMRAPSQRFTDRFGPGYTIGLLGVTALMFFVWWWGFGITPFENTVVEDSIQFSAFYRAMTLLVVASPCALVLSIPSAILAAIAWGAKQGILFRGGAAIEQLAGVEVVALDKTGTLTTGDLRVVSIESFPEGREREVAEAAYTLEQSANHPIARAIVQYGKELGLDSRKLDSFKSLTGRGVRAEVDGQACLLGKRELLEEGPLSQWANELPEPPLGLSEVWFVSNNLLGRILLEDTLRPSSATVLERLHSKGLRSVMLTGDRIHAAEAVAAKTGVSEVRAGLSPQGKVDAIAELKNAGQRVAMVGDGINDAPCLAAADVGVAMGARGSDAALEQSDVVLMNDKIENFYEALLLSKRARNVIRQNLIVSLGTILVMVVAAVGGMIPISIGVIAHEGSTVLVCLNSMRLLFGKSRTWPDAYEDN